MTVTADGVRETMAALRRVEPEAAKQLRRDWKLIGARIADDAKGRTMTRQQAAAARGFGSAGDRDGPVVVLRNLASAPFVLGAFFGARARFGNYGWKSNKQNPAVMTGRQELRTRPPRKAGTVKPQFPAWIGNQHDAGDNPTVGEYGMPSPVDKAITSNWAYINEAIGSRLDQVNRDLFAA